MTLPCIICTLNLIDETNNIVDDYIYRVPYDMKIKNFLYILDTIIKSIFIEDKKYIIYITKNDIDNIDNIDIKKLNKFICINQEITIFEKVFKKNVNKICNFKLLIKEVS